MNYKKLSISNIKKYMYSAVFDDFNEIIKATKTKTELQHTFINGQKISEYVTIYYDINNTYLFYIRDNVFTVCGPMTKVLREKYNMEKNELNNLIHNVISTKYGLNINVSSLRPVALRIEKSKVEQYKKFVDE